MNTLDQQDALLSLVSNEGWNLLVEVLYEEQANRINKLSRGGHTLPEYEAIAAELRAVDRIIAWPNETLNQLIRGE